MSVSPTVAAEPEAVPAVDQPSADGGRTPGPARCGLRAAWPALAAYASLRIGGVLVLWIVAANRGRGLGALLGAYDGEHYVSIVTDGYDRAIPVHADGTLATTNLAFFPLYPWLAAGLDPILPGHVRAAAILVSWAAGLAAAWGLFAIGAHLRDRRTGAVLAGLWAVVPHAVVQSMAYTETLFTALAAWSLYAVLRRSWPTAGVLSLLAGLTRPTGAALVAAVGAAALLAALRRRDGWRPWLAAALAPMGLVGYVAWVGHRLGRADGYLHVQRDAWRMSYDGGRYTLTMLHEILTKPQPLAYYMTTLVLLVTTALLVLVIAERPPWPLLLYALAVVVMVAGGAGYYHAKARLLMPAFPLLLPVVYGLVSARRRTAIVVFAVLAVLSTWYGVYLCLIWGYSP